MTHGGEFPRRKVLGYAACVAMSLVTARAGASPTTSSGLQVLALAGRQRMLVQRMSSGIYFAALDLDAGAQIRATERAADRFEHALRSLDVHVAELPAHPTLTKTIDLWSRAAPHARLSSPPGGRS